MNPTKDIRPYLHLYKGCTIITPYGDCRFMYYKECVDEQQCNRVVVNRGDTVFEFKLEEVKFLLRRLSSRTIKDAVDIFIKARPNSTLFNTDEYKFKVINDYIDGNIYDPELTRILLQKDFWLFGDDWFDEGIIIDADTLK